ncbi:MAG TPA: hypothetical protein VK975_07310 [Acidimicrobiales bacterium]|nr:hypothetical protein [Acidimicrobiales bacterium]
MGLAGVVAGVALFGGIALLAGSGGVDVRLGDEVFVAGEVDRLSAAVERDGPIAIPDASPRRQRDVYLQHLGTTPEEGWLAFSAQAPGAQRRCLLQWLPAEEQFADPCSDRRFPANGQGLTRYPTTVEEGRLSVDLRQPS